MTEDRNVHVVDGIKQLLFERIGDVCVQRVSFERLVVLPVELRDLYGCGGWGSVSLDAWMKRGHVGDGTVQSDVLGGRHDKR